MQEVGKEIKGYTELNGRTDSNMIDALNALYNYGYTKEKLVEHMKQKELTLTPAGVQLSEYEYEVNAKVTTKIDAL